MLHILCCSKHYALCPLLCPAPFLLATLRLASAYMVSGLSPGLNFIKIFRRQGGFVLFIPSFRRSTAFYFFRFLGIISLEFKRRLFHMMNVVSAKIRI